MEARYNEKKQEEVVQDTVAVQPKSTNYIFKYNTKTAKVGGYKTACSNIEEIKTLNIANLEIEKDVRAGWIKFANERNDTILNQVQEANETFKRTYFSPDEPGERLTLLQPTTDFEMTNSTNSFETLNDVIKNIRSTLTSNYKFDTVELLNHGITLIRNACPKQGILESIFKKDPNIEKFNHSIAFFIALVKNEKVRLTHEPMKNSL